MKRLNSIICLIIVIWITACEPGSNSTARETIGQSEGQEITFSLSTASILQQVLNNPAVPAKSSFDKQSSTSFLTRSAAIALTFNGTMNIRAGATLLHSYPVSASINDQNWAVTLYQSFVLPVGTYTFELFLNRPNMQYLGSTTYTVVEGSNTIPLEIFPTIGDTVLTTEIVNELSSFRFFYSDIPGLPDFEPKLGIIVDGGTEQVFDISHDTGMTSTYLNLLTGAHEIQLKLYDGVQQKGKSISSQENQVIIAGQNISMDLAPIHGVNTFSMSVGGSDASFDIEIPTEIVNQAGDLSNLKVSFLFNGPGTGYSPQEGEVSGITYDSSGDFYSGHIEFSGSFLFSTINVYLAFIKRAENEIIGTCNFQSSLNTAERTSLCGIPVTNSLISSGKLLGTAGITVCEADTSGDCGTLIGGASVYLLSGGSGDEMLGITGTGGTISEGYLKSNLTAGTHTLRAVSNDGSGKFGDKTITMDALGVENVEIILSASAPTNPNIIINGGNQYTYSHFTTLTLTASDVNGITAYYVSENGTTPGDSGWQVVGATPNLHTNVAFEVSAGTGEKTIYAWFKNAAGHRSERVQGSVFVQLDTSLHIGNFEYAPLYSSSPDNVCSSLASGYRIADWQEIVTVIADPSVDTSDFKQIVGGGAALQPSAGTMVSTFGGPGWRNYRTPIGAFVTYNGNEEYQGKYFAITEPSDAARDTEFGWSPYYEAPIQDGGNIQLYAVSVDPIQITVYQNIFSVTTAMIDPLSTVRVLCYRDSGVHPLMNGSFNNDGEYWDHKSGSRSIIDNSMVLETNDTTSDYSRVEQILIGVRPSTNYQLSARIKTSAGSSPSGSDPKLSFGIAGAGISVTDVTYDTLPPIWDDSPALHIEMAGEGAEVNDFFFEVRFQIATDSSPDSLTVFFQFENTGTSGQSATIDDVVLDEL